MPDRKAMAHWYADHGIPVFPCVPGTSIPLRGTHGYLSATTDHDQITRWWDETPEANIKTAPDPLGIVVVDLDGPHGRENWEEMCAEYGSQELTYTVNTPHGLHMYFYGSLPCSASTLAHGVDIRGQRGCIMLPGSTVDGLDYTICGHHPIASIPPWLIDMVGQRSRRREPTEALTESELSEADRTAENVARVIESLRAAAPATIGCGSDAATLQIAQQALDYVSPDVAMQLIWDHWVQKCAGEWTWDWVARKVQNAVTYRHTPIGCRYNQLAREYRVELASPDPDVSPQPAKVSAKHIFRLIWDGQDPPEPTSWLIPDILPSVGLSVLYAPPQSYKSFVALDIAASIAAGLPSLGQPTAEGYDQPSTVIYAAGEGLSALRGQRLTAWKHHRGVGAIPLSLAFTRVPTVVLPEERTEFVNSIRDQCPAYPKLIVLDTFDNTMVGLDPYHPRDINIVLQLMRQLRDTFNCQILVLNHTNKAGEMRGGRGPLWAGVDTVLESVADPATLTCTLTVRKQKDSQEREVPLTLQGERVLASLAFTGVGPTTSVTSTLVANILRTKGGLTTDMLAQEIIAETYMQPPVDYIKTCEEICEALKSDEFRCFHDKGVWDLK